MSFSWRAVNIDPVPLMCSLINETPLRSSVAAAYLVHQVLWTVSRTTTATLVKSQNNSISFKYLLYQCKNILMLPADQSKADVILWVVCLACNYPQWLPIDQFVVAQCSEFSCSRLRLWLPLSRTSSSPTVSTSSALNFHINAHNTAGPVLFSSDLANSRGGPFEMWRWSVPELHMRTSEDASLHASVSLIIMNVGGERCWYFGMFSVYPSIPGRGIPPRVSLFSIKGFLTFFLGV